MHQILGVHAEVLGSKHSKATIAAGSCDSGRVFSRGDAEFAEEGVEGYWFGSKLPGERFDVDCIGGAVESNIRSGDRD